MKYKVILLAISIILTVIFNLNSYSQDRIDDKSPKDPIENLYNKAFVLENEENKIDVSIDIYLTLYDTLEKTSIYRAKSVLRLGIAYYKIGNKEL